MPISDIDFVITFKGEYTLENLYEELMELKLDWVTNLVHIKARVPIMRFKDKVTNIAIDLSEEDTNKTAY